MTRERISLEPRVRPTACSDPGQEKSEADRDSTNWVSWSST